MTYLYGLKPQYDNRKSFYRKAKVYKDSKGHLLLISYPTTSYINTASNQ